MKDFVFNVDTKIIFGENQLSELGKEIKKYGKKVLLCYGGGSIKKNGIYDDITGELKKDGIEYVELSGIEPNPRVDSAREGLKIARENKVDFILAVGGGSVVDLAKLISGAYYLDVDPWQVVLDSSKIEKALPIGVVLTIAATGTEMDPFSVITNLETKEKLSFASDLVLPVFSFMNPKYTFTVPEKHTVAGVCDIMSHTMENYFSLGDGCYFQNKLSEGLLKTCIKYGPILKKDPKNYEARANIMWASTWAINGLLDSGKSTSWSVHPMEHELSAFFDITHGTGLAILTPRWLEHCLDEERQETIGNFARNVFDVKEEDDPKAAKEGIKKLYEFFENLGVPMSLRQVGIEEDKLKEMADLAVEHAGGKIKGFKTLYGEDVYQIYKASF